jgi:hypothetical protein
MDFIRELWAFVRAGRKYWLLPVLLLLLLSGGLIVLAKGSAIAPLLYTLF